jgi:hypothetical protein
VADWSDVRLVVLGKKADVTAFNRRAKARPLSVFDPNMLAGENTELWAERMQQLNEGLYGKRYIFQVRNDDGREYFTDLSRQFPSLRFVLTWDYSGDGEIASCLIQRGRSKLYVLTDRQIERVLVAHGYDLKGNATDEVDQWLRFIDARSELRDRAEKWWLKRLSTDRN